MDGSRKEGVDQGGRNQKGREQWNRHTERGGTFKTPYKKSKKIYQTRGTIIFSLQHHYNPTLSHINMLGDRRVPFLE